MGFVIISLSNSLAHKNWITEVKRIASSEADVDNANADKFYLCNLKLGICSCMGFIMKGQLYFCSHMYVSLAFQHSCEDTTQLLALHMQNMPQYDDGQKDSRHQANKITFEVGLRTYYSKNPQKPGLEPHKMESIDAFSQFGYETR